MTELLEDRGVSLSRRELHFGHVAGWMEAEAVFALHGVFYQLQLVRQLEFLGDPCSTYIQVRLLTVMHFIRGLL